MIDNKSNNMKLKLSATSTNHFHKKMRKKCFESLKLSDFNADFSFSKSAKILAG